MLDLQEGNSSWEELKDMYKPILLLAIVAMFYMGTWVPDLAFHLKVTYLFASIGLTAIWVLRWAAKRYSRAEIVPRQIGYEGAAEAER